MTWTMRRLSAITSGQVGREVDVERVPASGAQEGVPGPVHQDCDLHRFGADRQRARFDARHVQQAADQVPHVVGLVDDDAQELAYLGGVQVRRGVQHGGRRAPDGGQRSAQLVAHHAEELGPQPLHLLQGCHVLHGDDDGLHPALSRPDGRGIEQHGDASAAGGLHHDLLGPHRLAGAERLGEGQLLQGELAPVGAPHGQHLQELFRRLVRVPQAIDDPPRLAVERHRSPGPQGEDGDADGRGVDQGLEVRPGAPLVPVPAGVGDDQRDL